MKHIDTTIDYIRYRAKNPAQQIMATMSLADRNARLLPNIKTNVLVLFITYLLIKKREGIVDFDRTMAQYFSRLHDYRLKHND